ncbi:uncharacterized protein LOC107773918 [Nicotiana tabacum]|uniref:Uncharacterized protein LOC107773918 n=2 Tax=Nicotiana TaxID=4085 RepID=A0A1S3Y9G4_TOBAC|nr:PREDICTED: uncharacterized protein LOC104211794 [Nicotiana sylvestris]XP_016448835.1 PREDICTED: uncharacterized protein LOC107773918 [Nicotiana tabacum]
MGVCGSKPKGCVGIKGRKFVHRKKHKISRSRNVSKSHSASHNLSKIEPSASADLSYNNPAFQGNAESWFDPEMVIESDCDDDFHSVQDVFSQNGSFSNGVSPRFSDFVYHNGNATSDLLAKHEQPFGCEEPNVVKEDVAKRNSSADSQFKSNNPQNEMGGPSPIDKTPRSMDRVGARVETGFFHNCGSQNPCLPCLACVASSDEKKKSLNPSSPRTRRKSSLTQMLSFKWRETTSSSALLSPKAVLQRPIAGSQIPCSPLERKMSDCWSSVEPNTFKVRGKNYFRDKKKEFAPNCAAFYPFGADVFLSARKIDHIARFVELPAIDSSSEVPAILVVNLQIPLYPPAIFQNEYDGEGMNIVLYFKLSDNYSKEMPVQFQENLQRLIHDEIEKIKSFPMDTNAPFRERLKFLGRVANMDDLQLSAAEKKLLNAYNEKPVLSRPQHEFYLGENYFEIDLDIHRFNYLARKGVESFKDRLKNCVLDFGLTIQGNKAEDLPENMLCCIRMKEIDYTKYHKLGF